MAAEHLPGDCAAFAQRQEFQHLVLFHCDMDARNADLDRFIVEIDCEIASLDDGPT
jgi:hypothetical protein